MASEIFIDQRVIGPAHPPYVIAELSGNHNGDLHRALALLDEAHRQGAHAVKIQTYTAETMTIKSDNKDFKVSGGLWDGKTLYELYDWAHTPWDWHKALFDRARSLGITLFSSPFDESAIEFLEQLEAPAYKIASFEMTDLPLVRKAAQTGKPLIVSTGMASKEEIQETVAAIRETGNKQFALLHCVSAYPANHTEANVNTVKALADEFSCVVGLSDHTLTNATSVAAVALGASIVEKHFIDSRESEGPDSAFSIEPHELRALVNDTNNAWEALGKPSFGCTKGEASSQVFRRSVYVVKDIKAGEPFTHENLRRIRPGYGVAPKYLDLLLGCQAPKDLVRGEPITPEILKNLGLN